LANQQYEAGRGIYPASITKFSENGTTGVATSTRGRVGIAEQQPPSHTTFRVGRNDLAQLIARHPRVIGTTRHRFLNSGLRS
jgi:hypothetical protein